MKELPLKQWFHEEAERTGRTISAIINSYYYHKIWKKMNLRRVNKRVVYVIMP